MVFAGLDNHSGDVVVLEIALHEQPGCVVDTVREIRNRLTMVGANVVEETIVSELFSIWRACFRDAISEEQSDLPGLETNGFLQCVRAFGEQAQGEASAAMLLNDLEAGDFVTLSQDAA